MFGIGWMELFLIALVMLIFVGPKHLPEMLRKLGRITAELKMASRDLRSQIDAEIGDLQSPSRMMRDLGRDFVKSTTDPYKAELEKTELELKNELHDAKRELQDATTRYAPTPEELSAPIDDDATGEKPTADPETKG